MFTIITDSAADLRKIEAEAANIRRVYIPIAFEGVDYRPERDDDFSEFYRLLQNAKKLPTTSQPPLGEFLAEFTKVRDAGESALVITLSSGLSGTYSTAQAAREILGYEKIYIVDSQQATITQRMLVDLAISLRSAGKNAAETAAQLGRLQKRITLLGLLDTLTYLKKGGRIPPSLAMIGNVLGIKPAVVLERGIVESIGKARGSASGRKYLWGEFEKNPPDMAWPIYFGYAGNLAAGESFMAETVEKYAISNAKLYPIGPAIGAHVGPGTVAIAYVKSETVSTGRPVK